MAGLVELGEIMLRTSQQRLEVVAQNIGNSSTPGFRAQRAFEHALTPQANTAASTGAIAPQLGYAIDQAPATLRSTRGAFDLALAGPGFFAVRDENQMFYARSAQFERTPEGRLVDSAGRVLQAATGGDVFVSSQTVEILADGAVLEDGVPHGRIGVFDALSPDAIAHVGGALFTIAPAQLRPADEPQVRQRAMENSNVDTANEMLQMMAAVRQAETGARIVQLYDTLIGQSITTLGRSTR